jgi:YD repeat-containing protein
MERDRLVGKGHMKNKPSFFVTIILALLFSVCLVKGQAQTSNACWSYDVWYFPDPIPAGWVCDQPGQGPFSMMCRRPNGKCPPPSWCPTCGKWIDVAGAPINLTNGNTYIQQTDVRMPGLGGGLALTRTWNSMWPSSQLGSRDGLFGPNWRSTYEERVTTDSSGYVVYSRSDGGLWMFANTGGSALTLVAPANMVASLSVGSSYWTMTFQNNEKRLFDNASGSLIAIMDRNGNTTQLSYDGQNRLVAVIDPASRHLYLGYASGSSRLVTSVTSDASLSLAYAYDAQGRLSQVTRPDQSTVSFEYDSNSMIMAVRDSQGKILESHTYDARGRGLTSSRADGVEAVAVSYPN